MIVWLRKQNYISHLRQDSMVFLVILNRSCPWEYLFGRTSKIKFRMCLIAGSNLCFSQLWRQISYVHVCDVCRFSLSSFLLPGLNPTQKPQHMNIFLFYLAVDQTHHPPYDRRYLNLIFICWLAEFLPSHLENSSKSYKVRYHSLNWRQTVPLSGIHENCYATEEIQGELVIPPTSRVPKMAETTLRKVKKFW